MWIMGAGGWERSPGAAGDVLEESSLELPPLRRPWKTKMSMCRVRQGDATEAQGKVFDLKEA